MQTSEIECKHPEFTADVTEDASEDGSGVVVGAEVRCTGCGVLFRNAREAREAGVFEQADSARRSALDAWHVSRPLAEHKPGMPKHIHLTIEHQPHALNYQTVEEWLAEHPGEFAEADRAQMIETGEVWHVQWYPNTPVGFQHVAAATFERVMELANAADPDDARP